MTVLCGTVIACGVFHGYSGCVKNGSMALAFLFALLPPLVLWAEIPVFAQREDLKAFDRLLTRNEPSSQVAKEAQKERRGIKGPAVGDRQRFEGRRSSFQRRAAIAKALSSPVRRADRAQGRREFQRRRGSQSPSPSPPPPPP